MFCAPHNAHEPARPIAIQSERSMSFLPMEKETARQGRVSHFGTSALAARFRSNPTSARRRVNFRERRASPVRSIALFLRWELVRLDVADVVLEGAAHLAAELGVA